MNRQLPLLDIFNSLRQRHGFPLGIDEYLVVVQSLQAGFGLQSREDLEQLCCTLWAKSSLESKLIRKLFQQMWIQIKDKDKPIDSVGNDAPIDDIDQRSNLKQEDEEIIEETAIDDISNSPENSQPQKSLPITLEIDEPVQVVKALRSQVSENSLNLPRYSLLDDYFPVTKRQMKQCWRYLRRPVREGIATELDVPETVAKIVREGILLKPVLRPPRINRTDLVLLIDREGSMVPFHALSQQLLETATRGGRVEQTRLFYFHDYVDEYVYRHQALIDAQLFEEMLAEAGSRSVVLIISDGGSARGYFDDERIKATQMWIKRLKESVKYVAWLNPMPSDSWQHTTAEKIAKMIPMFEMSRSGMNSVIKVLRGRQTFEEVSYD